MNSITELQIANFTLIGWLALASLGLEVVAEKAGLAGGDVAVFCGTGSADFDCSSLIAGRLVGGSSSRL